MSAPNSVVKFGNVEIGNAKKLTIIAGPCQLESRAHALEMASALKEMAAKVGVGLIYKTSFDKANRTSASARINSDAGPNSGCPRSTPRITTPSISATDRSMIRRSTNCIPDASARSPRSPTNSATDTASSPSRSGHTWVTIWIR